MCIVCYSVSGEQRNFIVAERYGKKNIIFVTNREEIIKILKCVSEILFLFGYLSFSIQQEFEMQAVFPS